jgi:hypothetical protein
MEKEKPEQRGNNIRIHERMLSVGYKTKDANPLLPVRSLAKNGQRRTHEGIRVSIRDVLEHKPGKKPPFSSILPISFKGSTENTENTVTRHIWRSSTTRL